MLPFPWPSGEERHPPPDVPFSLRGYACFSLVHNCPFKRIQNFLEEYPCAAPAERGGVRYPLQIAVLPGAPRWTAVSWPRPAPFFDMQLVTMGLYGESKPYAGAKFALFLALPDEAHREGGPLIAHPHQSGFAMEAADTMRGIFRQWEFMYDIGADQVTFRHFVSFPNYTGYLSTARIGFQMKWLEHLDGLCWSECPLFLGGSAHCERNTP